MVGLLLQHAAPAHAPAAPHPAAPLLPLQGPAGPVLVAVADPLQDALGIAAIAAAGALQVRLGSQLPFAQGFALVLGLSCWQDGWGSCDTCVVC